MAIDAATTDLINRNPTFFEKAVLAMCLQDRSFYDLVSRVLCRNLQSGTFIDDFQDVLANAVYAVQTKYMTCFAMAGAAFKPMDASTCRILLENLIEEQLLLPSEVDPAIEVFIECMQMSPGQVELFTKNGFSHWLKKRRMQWMYAQQLQSTDWNPAELIGETQRCLDALDIQSGGKKRFYVAGESCDETLIDVPRYSTGHPALNDALGGGLGRKEGTLFIGGTGSGKTVVATQLGGVFAMQGLSVGSSGGRVSTHYV